MTLYNDYRRWSDENGLSPVSRPKLRDIISTFRPEVTATRQRVVDPQTGEIKALWGLSGIRLRTPADDFPDDPEPSPDPVDPVPPNIEPAQKADSEAIRSGDPVDSLKSDLELETGATQAEQEVEEVLQNDRITGSVPPEKEDKPPHNELSQPDPVTDPPDHTTQPQPRLFEPDEQMAGKSDVLQYYPDLMPTGARRRSG